MDKLEQATLEFLRSFELGEPVYEPCGKGTFPDFKLRNNIIIEVTRLVRPPFSEGAASVETRLTSILQGIENALDRVIRRDISEFFFVGLHFRKAELGENYPKRIRHALSNLRVPRGQIPAPIWIDRNLRIDFCAALPREDGKTFRLGTVSGGLYTGWVVSDLLEQCAFAVQRKKPKLETTGFAEAWLAVGSHLTTGLSEHSFEDFSRIFRDESRYSKLLLVDPQNPSRSRYLNI